MGIAPLEGLSHKQDLELAYNGRRPAFIERVRAMRQERLLRGREVDKERAEANRRHGEQYAREKLAEYDRKKWASIFSRELELARDVAVYRELLAEEQRRKQQAKRREIQIGCVVSSVVAFLVAILIAVV